MTPTELESLKTRLSACEWAIRDATAELGAVKKRLTSCEEALRESGGLVAEVERLTRELAAANDPTIDDTSTDRD